MTILGFQKHILSWYKTHRRNLPWRNTKDPYRILVSEIMLQQTQVARVLPKYKEFLQKFPTLEKLAKASDKTLLQVWAGLGYWRRAKYLKETAKILTRTRVVNSQTSPRRRFGMAPLKTDKSSRAQTPKSRRDFEGRSFGISLPEHLEKLPGIGHYTARALACFAFGNAEAFLDTNIRRVYLHFFFSNSKSVSDKEILPIAQGALLPLSYGRRKVVIDPKEWHYALFDYGATVLKDKNINKRSKHYTKQSKFEGSFRSFRAKAVRFLLSRPKSRITHRALESFLKREFAKNSPLRSYSSKEIIASLLKDHLIKKQKNSYSL